MRTDGIVKKYRRIGYGQTESGVLSYPYPDIKPSSCVKGANSDIGRRNWIPGACFPLPHLGQREFFWKEGRNAETRVAVMSIIVENPDSVEALNALLHQYGEYIIGRMGIPYRKRGVSIISIAMDAPQNTISALSGKVGSLPGVSVKTAYSNVISSD